MKHAFFHLISISIETKVIYRHFNFFFLKKEIFRPYNRKKKKKKTLILSRTRNIETTNLNIITLNNLHLYQTNMKDFVNYMKH